MCSINGCTWRDRSLVERMNAKTAHRGPDATGVYEDDVTLGSDRLAIIDLSDDAKQPMESADGRFVIAFNGEIYNYRELKKELSSYPFRTESDTEVILAGFSRWGTEVFRKLNGIFSIALFDKSDGSLTLARDRMGIKPLYVFRRGKKLLFSSEIKALFEAHEVPRALDREALELYLRLGYVPGPRTLFKNIEKFPPGCFARVHDGAYQPVSFVESLQHPSPSGLRDFEERVRGTIDAAVRRQLVSDRPLGVFLSGGIDSSIVTDAMSRAGSSIDTYSLGFEVEDPSEREKFNADFELARKTAAHYGTRHHEFFMGTNDLPDLFEDAIYHLDEPVGNATALAQLALSRFAKDTVTVVLCGDGGDELFGGYERYRKSLYMDAYQKLLPGFVRNTLSGNGRLQKLNAPSGAARYALFHFIKDDSLKGVSPRYTTERALAEAGEALNAMQGAWPEKFLELDRRWWLTDESLLRSDKMSMAAGIELRVPLLDNEVIALANAIPFSEKVTFFDTKRILKRAFKERLPAHVLGQPKRGWFSPGAKWLRVPEFEAYVREALTPGYAKATEDIFDWKAVADTLEAHIEKRKYNLHLLWSLLALQVWARRFDVSA